MTHYLNGQVNYQDHTVQYNCPWEMCWIEYQMSIEGEPQLYYTTYDEFGGVVDDSILLECVDDPNNAGRELCTFFLGHLDNPEEDGVQNNWQRRAGIRTAEGTQAWRTTWNFKCG